MTLFKLTDVESGEEFYFAKKLRAAQYAGTSSMWLDTKLYSQKLIRNKWKVEKGEFPELQNKYIIG